MGGAGKLNCSGGNGAGAGGSQSNNRNDGGPGTRVINYCWLRTSEFPIVMTFVLLLANGKSELGFCDCNICNQAYREIVLASKNKPGK